MSEKQEKTFPVNTRVSKKHFNAIGKMKPITITPKEHDEGEHELTIDFNAKKHLNRFHRNLKAGRGFVVKPEHFHAIHSASGGSLKSFGRSIRKGFKKIKKGFVKAGNKISSVAQDVAKNKVFKAVVKEVAPVIAGEVAKAGTTYLTGSPALGNVVGKVADKGTKAGINASGWGIHGKRGRPSKSIAVPVKTPASSSLTVPIGVKYGGDILDGQQGLGGHHAPESFGLTPDKMKDRMAYVRSHRKAKTGGSFLPLSSGRGLY